jgi:hypothetical protein
VSSADFYARLIPVADFTRIADPDVFVPFPPGWYLLLTDIRGSTRAIEAGRYKDVNALGAATIIAVLNAIGRREIPYVFGGDGATLLVPEQNLPAALTALAQSRALARSAYGLELRTACLSVARVEAAGARVLVAKVGSSAKVSQAVFAGGGLALADALVKDAATAAEFLLPEENTPFAPNAFEGLECRWSDIRAEGRRYLSLLVVAHGDSLAARGAIYRELLARIGALFDDGTGAAQPVTESRLRLSFSPVRLAVEAKARTAGRGFATYLIYIIYIFLGNVLGTYFFSRPGVRAGVDWQAYRRELGDQTDARKFDDTLRMVLAATPAQVQALRALLEEGEGAGRWRFGLHASDHALMTCLVFDLQGRHVHFVDGGDGGYAVAAKSLKQKLAP